MPHNNKAYNKPIRKYRETNRAEFDCTLLEEPRYKTQMYPDGNQLASVTLRCICNSDLYDKKKPTYIPLYAYGDLAKRIMASVYKGCSVFVICELTSHKLTNDHMSFGFNIQRIIITNYPLHSIDENGNPISTNTNKKAKPLLDNEELFDDFPAVPWYPLEEEPLPEMA